MNRVKNWFLLTTACLIYGMAFAFFLKPANIAPGGFSGIAIIINHITQFPIGMTILLLNLPIFIIAFKSFGKELIIKTIYCTVLSSMSIDIFLYLFDVSIDPLLSAIYGGIFLGAALGIVFANGGTTGGTDILSSVIQKRYPHFSLGQLILIIDLLIISTAIVVFKNISAGLYGIITLYITTKIIDLILDGSNATRLIFIISDKSDEIVLSINHTQNRGATLLHATGSYTNIPKNVIMCAASRDQMPNFKRIVKGIDPDAFMITTDAYEVLGYGFKSLKD